MYVVLALKRALYYVHKPLFCDCICTSPSLVSYCTVPMFVIVLGKGAIH